MYKVSCTKMCLHFHSGRYFATLPAASLGPS